MYRSKEGKLRAMLREVRRAHKTGQPILVGTPSVETSELIADALQELNISCKVRVMRSHTYAARCHAYQPLRLTICVAMHFTSHLLEGP